MEYLIQSQYTLKVEQEILENQATINNK